MTYDEIKAILIKQLERLDEEASIKRAFRQSSLPELTTAMCMIISALNSLPVSYMRSCQNPDSGTAASES